jgi:glutamate racemase
MIGVFDSGLGGLTVLREILNKLPQYDYIYLGDNARAPYGNKSEEVIYNYTREAVDFLFKEGCELIIIACNTASAKALRKIQQEFLPLSYREKKVLGVIIPVVEAAAELNNIERVGLIGTRATIESKTYERELNNLRKDITIYNQSCPLLVPLVEEGWSKMAETKKILKKYLRPLKEKKIDVLILGCTHYPILTQEIKQIMGKRIKILDAPGVVAEKLVYYLNKHQEIERKLSKNGKRLFYTTDSTERFKEMGKRFLGEEIGEVRRIEL